VGATDAAARAGDEHDVAVELAHRTSLPRRPRVPQRGAWRSYDGTPPPCRRAHPGGVPIFLSRWSGGCGEGVVVAGVDVVLACAEHGQDDVAAASGEADECSVVLLAFGAFAVVEAAGVGRVQRRERCEEHGVLQAVVPASALGFAADAGAGLSC